MFILLMPSKRSFADAFEGLSGSQLTQLSQMATSSQRSRVSQTSRRGYRLKDTDFPRINSKATIQKQLGQVKSYLRKTAPELKYVDNDISTVNIVPPGNVTLMTGIAQGDLVGERTGNVVHLRSINLKGYFDMPIHTVAVGGNLFYRVAVVQDLQASIAGTNPTLAQIFTPSTTPVTLFPSIATLGRFKIHWVSKVFDGRMLNTPVIAGDPVTVPTQTRTIDFNWKGNVMLDFFSTGATNYDKNPFYVCVICNDGTNVTDFTGTARIGFSDA